MGCAIVGGAGFIGSHLSDFLVSKGEKVIIIDNLSSGKKENINPETFFVPFDVVGGEINKLAKILKNCSEVWHFAGNASVQRGETDRFVDLKENVQGTVNVLEASVLAGVKKIFFASSSAVYGLNCKKKPNEKTPCEPISMYGASKLAAEGYFSAYCNNFKLSGGVLRLANVVGSRQRWGVLCDAMKQIKEKKIFLRGCGFEKKSYIHISDCISAFEIIRENVSEGRCEIFNIGLDDKISVKTIATIIEKETKKEVEFLGGKTWAGDIPEMSLNCNKLKSFGWNPKIVKSKEAIKTTIKDFLERGNLF